MPSEQSQTLLTEDLREAGVRTVGELYERIRAEITEALSAKPSYMRKFDFCLTEQTGDGFADLEKNLLGKSCPLKNTFSFERAYSARKGSEEPIRL